MTIKLSKNKEANIKNIRSIWIDDIKINVDGKSALMFFLKSEDLSSKDFIFNVKDNYDEFCYFFINIILLEQYLTNNIRSNDDIGDNDKNLNLLLEFAKSYKIDRVYFYHESFYVCD